MHRSAFSMALIGLSLCSACSDDPSGGEGKVRVLVTAEETITDGLQKGDDVENTRDYDVTFSTYLATVGNVRMARSRDNLTRELSGSWLLNMKDLGSSGLTLGTLDDLPAGEWDKFGFETPRAGDTTVAGDGVSEEQRAEMVDNGYTYWIEGTVERSQAEGGPVRFTIKTAVPTVYSDCSYEGEAGFSVVDNGTATATITLHGDHIFFNSFPTGNEDNIERLAAWVVAADVDGDGAVSTDDLAEIDASDLFTQGSGYSLTGAPIEVLTALDFVRAQLASQGHFRGEGECIFELDDD